MAEAGKDQDQSMEDILQSIKRIIAEEGDPVPDSSGSDVLELTEMLEAEEATPHTPAKSDVPPAIGSMSLDEIMAMPAIEPKAEPMPEPKADPVEETFPDPAPAAVAPAAMVESDSLISDITREASSAALDALRARTEHTPNLITRGMEFRSGATVEDLVIEAVKPMLKDWLDGNLTELVERLVEREIRKLSGR